MATNYDFEDNNITEEPPDLVINHPAKIQAADKEYKHNQTASVKAVIIKWISTIFMALLFLACLVHSRITILALSESLHAPNSLNLIARTRLFVLLQIIAVVPHFINMVRGIWCGLLRADRKWPIGRRKWILATFVSLLESFGLCLFIFCIPGLTKTHHVILLMNCVFLFPLLDNIRCLWINRRHHRDQQSRLRSNYPGGRKVNISWAGALFAELVGIAFTAYLHRKVPVNRVWIAPVGVVCVSLAWMPSLQKYLVENSYTLSSVQDSANGHGTRGNVQEEVPNVPDNLPSMMRIERTAWKLTTWMSFVKLVSTIGFSMLIYLDDTMSPFPDSLRSGVDIHNYMDGWKELSGCSQKELYYFIAHMAEGLIGYIVGYIACTTRSQLLGFSVPLMSATPLSVTLLAIDNTCRKFLLHPGVNNGKNECVISDMGIKFLILATFFLVLAQVLSTWWLLVRSQLIVNLGEDQLFWTPMYNSALFEHWIMLTRRNELTDIGNVDLHPLEKARRSRIFICTTMYRENEEEMKQLLQSLQLINDRVTHSTGLKFESHIFFDGAVKKDVPTGFLSQLVSLVEDTFGTLAIRCTKTTTPYGMSLSWRLVSCGKEGMYFTIHLKDNQKVKNKKRWSQVMYMSYVLDCQLKQSQSADTNYDMEEESYILTTDADVQFTLDNVEALLDFMTLDYSVGAVCARTHPLGSGPVVWYQKFDYAIAHWFQKASEHVIGSVLCAPGCFSVYRCKAIREVLPLYASNVEQAEEFLTKDMGEDRWLCTLLIQSGWRIEYCAASENKTHCPEDFDEFFKQRRRWIVSTLANLWLLINKWRYIRKHNLRVSYLFLVYQVLLLVATLIAPSSVLLVVSGGLKYGMNFNPEATLSLQLVLCLCFTLICLYTSQRVQLYAAKLLTCFYAILMMIVAVGTAVEIVTDIRGAPGSEASFISDKIRISTTSVYLFSVAGLVVLAAILHLREFPCVFHGFVYLLFLPAGYLILIIYSICNITDSSWGTRESTEEITIHRSTSWQGKFKELFQNIFFCCFNTKVPADPTPSIETKTLGTQAALSDDDDEDSINKRNCDQASQTEMKQKFSSDTSPEYDDDLAVEDWLDQDMMTEARILRQNGFDKTSFISGMTEKEIQDTGIKNKGKIHALLGRIQQLKDYEIPVNVPENVECWLKTLDLLQYKDNFIRNNISTQQEMEVLKDLKIKEIRTDLGITKYGHIKRLVKGINQLRKPTIAEQKRATIQRLIINHETLKLEDVNADVYAYWEYLRKRCLIPQSAVFESDEHLKGFVVIVLFSFILLLQFLAMIVHRISTLMHFLGRTPYKCNSAYNSSWMFDFSDLYTLEETERKQFHEDSGKAEDRIFRKRRTKDKADSSDDETTPLVSNEHR
ncbi:chitin synthase-like isoform X2 [Mercenaria mercenaria]|uniref:chitin synthase-like isoform X2 n=1 Tax=Mercenaria mercenaria TaxID=6596 RepID=UPI00234EA338|nr:chitin synthase-like isoform X2 [Mercenaria mercenaria]